VLVGEQKRERGAARERGSEREGQRERGEVREGKIARQKNGNNTGYDDSKTRGTLTRAVLPHVELGDYCSHSSFVGSPL
jgi:hypothetical protein